VAQAPQVSLPSPADLTGFTAADVRHVRLFIAVIAGLFGGMHVVGHLLVRTDGREASTMLEQTMSPLCGFAPVGSTWCWRLSQEPLGEG